MFIWSLQSPFSLGSRKIYDQPKTHADEIYQPDAAYLTET